MGAKPIGTQSIGRDSQARAPLTRLSGVLPGPRKSSAQLSSIFPGAVRGCPGLSRALQSSPQLARALPGRTQISFELSES
eukprot:5128989-Alexandrium_andersonii.AAC.1